MALRSTDAPFAHGTVVPGACDLLVGTPVSTRVNSVQNDDPDCVRVAGDAVSVT